jgi:hypothetical protein
VPFGNREQPRPLRGGLGTFACDCNLSNFTFFSSSDSACNRRGRPRRAELTLAAYELVTVPVDIEALRITLRLIMTLIVASLVATITLLAIDELATRGKYRKEFQRMAVHIAAAYHAR